MNLPWRHMTEIFFWFSIYLSYDSLVAKICIQRSFNAFFNEKKILIFIWLINNIFLQNIFFTIFLILLHFGGKIWSELYVLLASHHNTNQNSYFPAAFGPILRILINILRKKDRMREGYSIYQRKKKEFFSLYLLKMFLKLETLRESTSICRPFQWSFWTLYQLWQYPCAEMNLFLIYRLNKVGLLSVNHRYTSR